MRHTILRLDDGRHIVAGSHHHLNATTTLLMATDAAAATQRYAAAGCVLRGMLWLLQRNVVHQMAMAVLGIFDARYRLNVLVATVVDVLAIRNSVLPN